MLYQIKDGTVTAGGQMILSHIDFEIKGTEKIAVVGKNGAGKTTLLRLIAGELELDRDDRRADAGISCARKLTVGMLKQQAFSQECEDTVEEILLSACPCKDTFARERFEYEREYDMLFTGFGFLKEDKKRRIRDFSGGEQTKIAFIQLFLEKPDVLLLDEPTNHLDVETSQWLEQYMRTYEMAVVMVSHDRFFLDQTADVVYELSGNRLTRYPGNYTHYKEEKRKQTAIQRKAYERQQEEIKRLEELVERFKTKPNKAAFARSKKKMIERITPVPKPEETEARIFTGEINPLIMGSKWVFESEHLKIGYDRALLEISLRIRRGQKIGILGANGAGKTTFLKTIAGMLEPVDGEYSLGANTVMGYFDQHTAEISSEKQVIEHFHDLFPVLTDKEARSVLGAYLFGGRDAAKRVEELSGGEKSRLVLAELLQSRPNFLVLDEPTNHMDIQAKETLESAFQAYKGTILFVSHDRYFLSQVADAILIFEGQSVMYYPFGYQHYVERCRKEKHEGGTAAMIKAEEQALIAGIRSVPKAERHRLREIPTEEAYVDWQLRLAVEQMQQAEAEVVRLIGQMEKLNGQWQESEGFWAGGVWDRQKEYEELWDSWLLAEKRWNERCLEWCDIFAGVSGGFY